MSVVSHDHSFDRVRPSTIAAAGSRLLTTPQLRVDVLETDTVPEIRPYTPGTPLSSASAFTLPYPVTLSAVAKLDYYSQQQGFNIFEMFKNPMMLMMVFGAIMVFATPYLMVRYAFVRLSFEANFCNRNKWTPRL
jgi:ER membrane protein complex subunit 7